MKIDLMQLCEAVQEYLDTDPRYFDQAQGVFPWWGMNVYYEKTDDEFHLHIVELKQEVSCPRL